MPTTATITSPQGPVQALQNLLARLLADEEIAAVFTPRHLPARGAVMPSLITDPAMLESADPISPSFPLNSARQLSRLTRGDVEGKILAVMRPCEIRGFIELVKLNQGSLHNVVLAGIDCLGAFDNAGFRSYLGSSGEEAGPRSTAAFLAKAAAGDFDAAVNGHLTLARACQVCEHPAPDYADIVIGLYGADLTRELLVFSATAQGEALLNRMAETLEPLPNQETAMAAREKALQERITDRIQRRDAMFEKTREATATPALLAEYLSGCVNCYNCRVACPVCFCKECVFVTDVFDHEPWQYLGWARQKGVLRMPTDTMFYHLTRMAHMSTACVGCGQCSNACPNDIPIMELFRTVADRTQQAFGYSAGKDPQERPPLAVFQEKELSEVTGGRD